MKLWIDEHISPGVAAWINGNFTHEAQSLSNIGLREATDFVIYQKAKSDRIVLVSIDSDFVDLIETHGSSPKLIYLRSGNTSNKALREIFVCTLIVFRAFGEWRYNSGNRMICSLLLASHTAFFLLTTVHRLPITDSPAPS